MPERRPAALGREQPVGTDPLGPYGVPMSVYARLWTVADVAEVMQVAVPRARALLAEAGAPPPLARGKRLLRWNGAAVMAWLHDDDWSPITGAALRDGRARPPEPRRTAPAAEAPTRPARLLSKPATRRKTKT